MTARGYHLLNCFIVQLLVMLQLFSNKINPDKVRYVSLTNKIFFLQNLQVMVRTGISLSVALRTLAEDTPNKSFKAVLGAVAGDVDKGNSLAKSLSRFKRVFGEMFINMVESGEISGKLEDVLLEVLTQMRKDHDLISKVRGAMIYPAVIVVAMIGVAAAMIVFVIPKLTSIFREVGGELPLPTRILMAISDFAVHHGILLVLILFVLGSGFVKFARTKSGKRAIDWLFLKAPIVGSITKKINLARFSRTLSSLMKTDIPIVQSFLVTSRVLGNSYFQETAFAISEQIKKGSSIHEIMSKHRDLFPTTMTQMVSVGEETGAVDDILQEVASFYEGDIDQIMKNLPSVIEPILILILGLGVGALAVSIILPLYSLTQQF